jgi:hypothetical protein
VKEARPGIESYAFVDIKGTLMICCVKRLHVVTVMALVSPRHCASLWTSRLTPLLRARQ